MILKWALNSILAGLFLSSSAWASFYSISIEAQINHDKPIKGHVVLNEGDTGSFSSDATVVKFVPLKTRDGAVKILAEITERTPQGSKNISTTLVVKLNQSGEVIEKFPDGAKDMVVRLKLTPRQN